MHQYFKHATLTLLLSTSLFAGEFQYGNGTIDITGGFIGLNQTISTDISTYSLVEKHRNIFSSSWYYQYNITWYDSKVMRQEQTQINTTVASLNNFGTLVPAATPYTLPSLDYMLQGLDVDITLGRDLYHKDENNFFGLGLDIGISLPWIESQKSDDNNDALSDNLMNAMEDSKTKMMTYKVGPSIAASVSLNKYFMLYGTACYAYQSGTFKNDYANTNLKVQGTFKQADIGIKILPFAKDFKTKYITLSPRLYASLGYRYTNWTLKDIAIDVTGVGTTFNETDFTSSNSVTYFGIGYDFF